MTRYENMGPFKAVSLKGNAAISGVPTFVDKLPLTMGGIAGEEVQMGRVVSINPTSRREFVQGVPSGNIVKGVAMYNPVISRADPAMNSVYFAGRPITVQTMGLIDILEYDTTQGTPAEGSTVWANTTTGLFAFNDGTDISASGYVQLNAIVYETLDPNGAKIWLNLPLVTTQTRETVSRAATPVPSTAAGAVTAGTEVALSSTTKDAVIYFTIDGSTPTMASKRYEGPLAITAAVTIKAIAIAPGYDPSTVLTAAYTIA